MGWVRMGGWTDGCPDGLNDMMDGFRKQVGQGLSTLHYRLQSHSACAAWRVGCSSPDYSSANVRSPFLLPTLISLYLFTHEFRFEYMDSCAPSLLPPLDGSNANGALAVYFGMLYLYRPRSYPRLEFDPTSVPRLSTGGRMDGRSWRTLTCSPPTVLSRARNSASWASRLKLRG